MNPVLPRLVPRLLAGLAIVFLAGCAGHRELVQPPPGSVGIASYYGKKFHGRKTASGERFDMNAMTAAHRTLPFGTKVRVTNLENGSRVVLRINDRGPVSEQRLIDVSYGAAKELGFVTQGLTRVRVEVL
jgi:rare lipoprotein A